MSDSSSYPAWRRGHRHKSISAAADMVREADPERTRAVYDVGNRVHHKCSAVAAFDIGQVAISRVFAAV
jgi:hypothetical protein